MKIYTVQAEDVAEHGADQIRNTHEHFSVA
jgi:hypothetical protein